MKKIKRVLYINCFELYAPRWQQLKQAIKDCEERIEEERHNDNCMQAYNQVLVQMQSLKKYNDELELIQKQTGIFN